MTGPWKDKVAVVCGGSTGFGFVLASELVSAKVRHLFLIARDSEKLSSARQQLQTLAPEIQSTIIVADLTDWGQTQAAVAQILQMGMTVDLLVQAIGKSDRGRLLDLTRQELLELVDVNACTSLHAVNAFAPSMPRGAKILLVGSLASLVAPRFLGGYAAAKHALAALAQQYRLELAEHGIEVTLACPGPIARDDAGVRYSVKELGETVPDQALQPGGGAKLNGLNPQALAKNILAATSRGKPLAIYPTKVCWLRIISAVSQTLGDRLLRKNTG